MRRGLVRVLVVIAILVTLFDWIPPAQAGTSRSTSFGYGIVVSNNTVVPGLQSNYQEVAKLGFDYVKMYISWNSIESTQGVFTNYPDNAVGQIAANNLKIIAVVFDTPAWANGTGSYNNANPPPSADHVVDFGTFMSNLATHFRGKIAAYEIWNEENVSGTWGNQNPDPTRFVAMLQAAYPAVKGADSTALVVSGGVANTGAGNGSSAIGDLVYLQDILQGGALGNIDAIGIHPYPGACDPTATSCAATPGTYFQRANEEHNTIVQFGGGNLPVWITEAGYFSFPGVIDPGAANCPAGGNSGIGGFNRYEVTETDKANWLVQAYQDAYNNWPWLGMFVLMNLDISMDSYSARAQCDPSRFWAILTMAGSETQAYTALKGMTKYLANLVIPTPATTPQAESNGTVTITGSISDPSKSGAPPVDQVTVTIDSPSGPNSPLATVTINPNGTFQVIIDVTGLSAYTTHQVYLNVHGPTEGWLSGSTGIYIQPLMTATPATELVLIDPSKQTSSAFSIALGRNDANSSPYPWNYTIAYGSTAKGWLTGPPPSIGQSWVGAVNAKGLANGTYTATVTINCPCPVNGSPSYFANTLTIPVTLIVGPLHYIAIPNILH